MERIIFYGNFVSFQKASRRTTTKSPSSGHIWWFPSSVCKGLLLTPNVHVCVCVCVCWCAWVFVFHLHTCIQCSYTLLWISINAHAQKRQILSLALQAPNNNFVPLFQIHVVRYVLIAPSCRRLPSSIFSIDTFTYALPPLFFFVGSVCVRICVCNKAHRLQSTTLLYI